MSQEQLDRITDAVLAHKPKKVKRLQAIAGAHDKPLQIGQVRLECYVLEDGTRVLSQRGLSSGLGATRGSRQGSLSAKNGGAELPRFLARNYLKPFINNDLTVALSTPIEFRPPHGGKVAFGYRAELLVDICDVFVAANKAGALTSSQQPIADRASALISAFAKTGIVARIDEATGYQDQRPKDDLQRFFDRFFAEEAHPWVRTFYPEFYEQICRLKGWPASYAISRPVAIAMITRDVVYSRVGPEVLPELDRRNPMIAIGGKKRRKRKFHQELTRDYGHPKLREHLTGIVYIMRGCHSWHQFMNKLDIACPKLGTTIPFDFDD